MKAEIEVSGNRGRIVLDGQDVSNGVRGFVLVGGVHRPPALELDITVQEFATATGEVRVGLTAGAERALIAAGWTPPDGGGTDG